MIQNEVLGQEKREWEVTAHGRQCCAGKGVPAKCLGMCSKNRGEDDEKKNYDDNNNRQGLISIGSCRRHLRSIKKCKNSEHGKCIYTVIFK